MNEIILIVMVMATIIYVGWPYWQGQAVIQADSGNGKLCELIEQRDNLLAQIKEIEFDCEVGTVSKEDYAEMNARYRDEAVSILRKIDALSGNNRSALKIEKELKQLQAQKKMDFKFNYQAIKLTKKAGIETRISMMLGLPGETPKMAEKTVDELIKLEPDFVQFHSTIAFPFTTLYQEGDSWGKISEVNDKTFDISGHQFLPKGYKDENELKQMISRSYRRFYLRPRYIFRKITKIKEWKRFMPID